MPEHVEKITIELTGKKRVDLFDVSSGRARHAELVEGPNEKNMNFGHRLALPNLEEIEDPVTRRFVRDLVF